VFLGILIVIDHEFVLNGNNQRSCNGDIISDLQFDLWFRDARISDSRFGQQ